MMSGGKKAAETSRGADETAGEPGVLREVLRNQFEDCAVAEPQTHLMGTTLDPQGQIFKTVVEERQRPQQADSKRPNRAPEPRPEDLFGNSGCYGICRGQRGNLTNLPLCRSGADRPDRGLGRRLL
jgi:hypothetical protein